MKARKPRPPFEFCFTMTRQGDGVAPHSVSLREEAATPADAKLAVALLADRMTKELRQPSEADEDARD